MNDLPGTDVDWALEQRRRIAEIAYDRWRRGVAPPPPPWVANYITAPNRRPIEPSPILRPIGPLRAEGQ